MDTVRQSDSLLYFGEFSLDRKTGELFHNGQKVRIQGQPVQILEALLGKPGGLVTQEELVQKLWPGDTHVDYEQGLRSAVQRLRAALEDSSEEPRFIETVPRKGYRYIGPPPSGEEGSGLAPEPVSPKAKSLGGALRIGAVVVILLVAVVAIVSSWNSTPTEAGPPSPVIKLAVLPLKSLDTAEEQDPFSKGLTTEIINVLAQLQPRRLEILAESVSSRYRDATEIRYAVKLDYVVEGTIRREGGRARVSVRLVPVFKRTQRWGETYEVDLGDPFAAQEDIAGQVARALWLALDLSPRYVQQ